MIDQSAALCVCRLTHGANVNDPPEIDVQIELTRVSLGTKTSPPSVSTNAKPFIQAGALIIASPL